MDDDDAGAADDERTIELSTIAAIFPELLVDPSSPYDAALQLPVTPASPLKIRFQQVADSAPPVLPTPPTSTDPDEDETTSLHKSAIPADKTQDVPEIHALAHLPALTLQIHLPQGYPSQKPGVFEISTSPPWIPKAALRVLKEDSVRLWEELGRDQVVYAYIDHLQQAAERGFDLAGDVQSEVKLSSDMKLALLDFDLKTKRELFEKETFDCGVCLEPKKGTSCHRLLLCSHVFCVACLQDFFNNCIKEGDVDNIRCLAPSCGKESGALNSPKRKKPDRTLNPSELLQIPLDQEVVQRYVHLKRKKKLESDKSTIYCPRQWCQGAARSKRHPKPIDPMNDIDTEMSESEVDEVPNVTPKKAKKSGLDDPPMSERLCICEDCNFAFCSVCKKGWHGELAMCNPRRQQELNEEEKASLQYLQLHSTPCPTCSAPCQKSMGCNHMICFKCRTHFCYLCSAYLMPDNPYRHFNELKSTCYMRLWELEGGDGDLNEVGIRFAGGRNWDEEESDDEDDSEGPEDLDEEGQPWEFVADEDILHLESGSESDDDDDNGRPPDDNRLRPGNIAPRDVRIEIVNFARAGVANQRIIQNVPRRGARALAVPPPAPIAPRRHNNGRRPGGQRADMPRPRAGAPQMARDVRARNRDAGARRQVPERQHDHDLAENDVQDVEEMLVRAAPAPGQGNGGAQQPAIVRAMGLERFLELAERDEEDEWDSDELDDIDENQVLPNAVRRERRMARR